MGAQQYDWHFVDSKGQQNGPHTRDELLARWRAGEVRGYTLVWAPQMPAWERFEVAFPEQIPPAPPVVPRPTPVEPLGDRLIEVAPRSPAPAAAIPAAWAQPADRPERLEGLVTAPGTTMSMGLHPWRRYFAKQFDVTLFALGSIFLIAIALGVLSPEAGDRFSEGLDNQIVAAVVVVFLWAILEWLSLTFIGTTPGRALYGIQVRMVDGTRLDGNKALSRAFLVGIKGLGLGVPIVTLITVIVGYNVLKRDGRSSWDAELGTRVTHILWSPIRAFMVVVTTLMLLMLVGVLFVIGEQG